MGRKIGLHDSPIAGRSRTKSRDWLGRQAGILPRLKTPVQGPHAFEAAV
jgi:hypothetical protein